MASLLGHRCARSSAQLLRLIASSRSQLGCPYAVAAGSGAAWKPAAAFGVRGFSEDLRVVSTALTENQFHKAADGTLDLLAEKFEVYVEENEVDGGDVEYSQGVLTLKLGPKGTFVLNKQTPNRQIWLSSPVSGPFRYDFQGGRWVYHRDSTDLVEQLGREVQGLVGAPLKLE